VGGASPASDGAPKSAELAKKIAAKRAAIGAKRSKERVLSSTIAGYSRRIGALQDDIGSLQRRQIAIQAISTPSGRARAHPGPPARRARAADRASGRAWPKRARR
jgi:hypothetical protein